VGKGKGVRFRVPGHIACGHVTLAVNPDKTDAALRERFIQCCDSWRVPVRDRAAGRQEQENGSFGAGEERGAAPVRRKRARLKQSKDKSDRG
jgi:hypothetical protein